MTWYIIAFMLTLTVLCLTCMYYRIKITIRHYTETGEDTASQSVDNSTHNTTNVAGSLNTGDDSVADVREQAHRQEASHQHSHFPVPVPVQEYPIPGRAQRQSSIPVPEPVQEVRRSHAAASSSSVQVQVSEEEVETDPGGQDSDSTNDGFVRRREHPHQAAHPRDGTAAPPNGVFGLFWNPNREVKAETMFIAILDLQGYYPSPDVMTLLKVHAPWATNLIETSEGHIAVRLTDPCAIDPDLWERVAVVPVTARPRDLMVSSLYVVDSLVIESIPHGLQPQATWTMFWTKEDLLKQKTRGSLLDPAILKAGWGDVGVNPVSWSQDTISWDTLD